MLLMVQKKLGIAFAPKHFELLKAYPEVILKPISFPSINTVNGNVKMTTVGN